jgi:CSLREA domain-containing protein
MAIELSSTSSSQAVKQSKRIKPAVTGRTRLGRVAAALFIPLLAALLVIVSGSSVAARSAPIGLSDNASMLSTTIDQSIANALAANLPSASIDLSKPNAPAATITVNTLTDEDVNPGDGCSLREAFTASQSNVAYNGCTAGTAGADLIGFSVQGTIVLGSALPAIVQPMTIDGGSVITVSGNDNFEVFYVSGATVSFNSIKISHGVATCGGGFDNSGGTVTVANSTFSFNQAYGGTAYGGAICNSGTLMVTNSTFDNNEANPLGGAIMNGTGQKAQIINSTFYSNSAASGGAIINYGTLTVTNSTFNRNGYNLGGGIYNYQGTTVLYNNLLISNTANDCAVSSGSITADAYNIDSDGTCASATTRTAAQINLSPLQRNGSDYSNLTMAPGRGSLAVNAGNNAVCPSNDQRYETRTGDGLCDVGAYERWDPVVNSVDDVEPNDGCAVLTCTLREAIDAIDAHGGDAWIMFSVAGTIGLNTALPAIYQNLTIDGGHTITVDGQNNFRDFNIGAGDTAFMNLAIIRGHADDLNGGGGIHNAGNAMTVMSSTFSNNLADPGLFGGGAIFQGGGPLTVTNSFFNGNSADAGGGIVLYGSAIISNSTFSANSAAAGSGGGVKNGDGGQLLVINSTFDGNSADPDFGGGLYSSGPFTVTNSTFNNNSATSGGGGIVGTGKLFNTLLINNSSGECAGITADSYNIDSDGSCDSATTKNAAQINLGPLTGQVMALGTGSAALNAGNTATCATADERGVIRSGDGACDVGAYEHLVVTSFIDPGDGVCDATCTLRDAINAANTNSDQDLILFSSDGSITLGSALPTIAQDLTLDGSGHAITVNGNNLYRIFQIDNYVPTTLISLTLTNGHAFVFPGGGAIYSEGKLRLINSTVSSNIAEAGQFGGGGIFNGGAGALTVTYSSLINNSADSGGGILNYGSVVLSNTTVGGNTASGGGINNNATLKVVNSTIAGNNGTGLTNAGTAALTNTLIANNTVGDCIAFGSFTANASNIASDSSCGSATQKTSAEINLGPLSNGIMALGVGSAALNTADVTKCPQTDQRGVTRSGDGACDVGAFEHRVVNSIADTNDGLCDASDCTLREAIDAANAIPGGDLILFSLDGTLTLGSALPAIAQDLSIDGAGHAITIDGSNLYRLFSIDAGVSSGLRNLTLINGYAASNGGGIFNAGKLTLANSTLSNNVVDAGSQGGGIYVDFGGALTVTHSAFNNNHSGTFGGGIGTYGPTFVSDSTFYSNTADSGSGGIDGNDSLVVVNSTFNANATLADGGAIGNWLTLVMTNSTVSGNFALTGGGIKNYNIAPELYNTLIADNTGGNCDGTISADAYNIASDSTCSIATQKTSAQINLGPLADNGGSTWTMALGANSAALNSAYNPICPATDQRGVTRSGDGACDVGSYEHLVVTSIVDPGDGVCDADCTLREALIAANTTPGADVITFNTDGVITLTAVLTNINESLTLNAQGHSITINGDNSYRLFIINNGVQANFSHLTLANGHAADLTGGGGIYNEGNLVLENSTLANNIAEAGFSGGGIYISTTGTLTATNSTFNANSADSGGGIMNYGVLTLTNSTFGTNNADVAGGGLANNGTATLRNTLLANNTNGDCSGTLGANSNNIDSDGSCDNATQHATGINLGSLANNGGNTWTMAIGIGSAAKDAGDNAVCPAIDQRGQLRSDGACDVGAVERQDRVVTSLVDPGDGICDATCTLREAIDATNAVPGADTITFNVDGTITLGSMLPAISDAVTIDGSGHSITISGDNQYRVFMIGIGIPATLRNLTVVNGSTSGNSGGVFNQGQLNVIDSAFSNNNAGLGSGGAFYNDSSAVLTLTNSSFTNNSGLYGGGSIENDGLLMVISSTFSGNTAASGNGAAIESTGSASVISSTFSGNSTSGDGGAIVGWGSLTVENSVFNSNHSDFSSAIYGGSWLSIVNSTFYANTGAASGGAIVVNDTLVMTNTTVNGNSGIGIQNNNIATLHNSIVSSNSGGDCGGTLTADAYNLDSDGTCNNATQKTAAQINLGSFANGMLIPSAGSAALNAGDNSVCPQTDQRGAGRSGDSACDVGAIEHLVVTSIADPGNGVCDATCTLREAMTSAETLPGADLIMFNVNGVITLASSNLPTINQSVTIDGLGHTITINGNGAYRFFTISGTSPKVNLSHLTLDNGHETAGGAIYNEGKLTLSDSTLSNSSADPGQVGGGIFNNYGTVTVTHSSLINNSADTGGGIQTFGGMLFITNSTFMSNTVTTDGGGLHSLNGTPVITIYNSTFKANSAAGLGGGLNTSGALLIVNSTFMSNTAGNWGGALASNGPASIINSTFNRNSAVNSGGGIGVNGAVVITNSTIAGNLNNGLWGFGSATLYNTLVANNTVSDCSVAVTANANNIDSDGTCNNATPKTSAEIALTPLADNGGSSWTMALLPGSVAIDAGDNAACTTTDERGVIRSGYAPCDVGAFESRGFNLSISSGNDQATKINLAFPLPLSVTVSSSNSEPVNGGKISFAGPIAGARALPVTGTKTIVNGTVGIALTANSITGTYHYTASTRGAANAVFNLQNVDSDANILTISKAGTGDGVVTPTVGSHIYVSGSAVALQVTAYPSSTFGAWSGNADCTDGSVTMTADRVCTATFTLRTYTISPSAGSNGSITPNTNQIVNYGGSSSFVIAANSSYHILGVWADGVPQGAVSNYTFNNVTANHTITASFAINTYTITPSAGAGGSITPNTAQNVNHGGSIGFTIVANTGYHIADVLIDGVSQGVTDTVTFNNVTAHHTIAASFAIDTFTITPIPGLHGSISPLGAQTVNYGSNRTFNIAGSTGYHVSGVWVDGVLQGALNTYTFNSITTDHTITASFAINTYLITPSVSGPNGAISPNTPQTVNYGNSKNFNFVPNLGFQVADVGVDGVSFGAIGSYQFSNVAANHAISVSFKSSGAQTKTVGIVNVIADNFDLPINGEIKAYGNLHLGQYLFITGPGAKVTYNATTITATGKLVVRANGEQLDILTGTFKLPTASGLGAPIGSPIYLVDQIAGYEVTNVTVAQIDVLAGLVNGTGILQVKMDDVEEITSTPSVNFTAGGSINGLVFGGTLGAFSFNVAGATIIQPAGAIVTNDGISNDASSSAVSLFRSATQIDQPEAVDATIDDALIKMPDALGGLQAKLGKLALNKLSLVLAKGKEFPLPTMAISNSGRLGITRTKAFLAYDLSAKKFQFSITATLLISLPGNILSPTINIKMKDGQITGTVTSLKVQMAGFTLTMNSTRITSKGLYVDVATLALPPKFRGKDTKNATFTVRDVNITDKGLTIGNGRITMDELKFGKNDKVRIITPTLVYSSTPGGYMFNVSGTLELKLSKNSQQIPIDAQILNTGQFTATIGQLRVTLGSVTLAMTNSVITNGDFAVQTATLTLPPKFNNLTANIYNVTIDSSGPHIGGAGVSFSIPSFRIGSTSGISVVSPTVGFEAFSIPNGFTYKWSFSGKVTVAIKGTAPKTISGTLTIDGEGHFGGNLDSFDFTIAGLTLAASGIKFNDGNLEVGSASMKMPSAFGGAEAAVYNLVVRSDGSVKIGGGKITLPTIKAGGFTLKEVTAEFKEADGGGYEFTGSGYVEFPGVGSASGCKGVGVSVTIWTDAFGQTQLTLGPAQVEAVALKDASFYLDSCQIPIGTTGLYITGLSGQVTLTSGGATVKIKIEIAAGKKVAGVAVLSADASATLTTSPFDLVLAGTVNVFVFKVGGADAHLTDHSFKATLWVDIVIVNGQIVVNAWSDYKGFHFTGTAIMDVGLRYGSLWEDCVDLLVGDVCIGFPPFSLHIGTARIDVGEFTNGNWGLKGTFEVLGKSVGVYIDTGGTLAVTNMDSYQLAQAPAIYQASQKWRAAQQSGLAPSAPDAVWSTDGIEFVNSSALLSQTVPITTDLIFGLVRTQSVPTLTLLTPSNVEITPSSLGISYTEISTYTAAARPTSTLPTTVRFTNAQADLGAVDVLIDGVKVFNNVGFGNEANTQSVGSGSHSVVLLATGTAAPNLYSGVVNVTANTTQRLIAVGQFTQTTVLNIVQGTLPEIGKSMLRFTNASPDAPALDIDSTAYGVTTTLFGFASALTTTDPIKVNAGQIYTFTAYASGSITPLAQLTATLASRAAYNLIARGAYAYSGSPALQLSLQTDSASFANVRLVNAIPASGAIDLWTQGITVFQNIPYTATSAYRQYQGNPLNAQIKTTGGGTILTSTALSLQPDGDHTIIAINSLASAETLLLTDDNMLPPWGKSRVRFVNASPDAPAVDVIVLGDSTWFSNVAYRSMASYITPTVNSTASITFEVRDHNTTNLLLTVPNVNLIDGYVYTLLLSGLNGGSPSLELIKLTDAVNFQTIRQYYLIEQGAAGIWKLKLNGISTLNETDTYLVTMHSTDPAPVLTGLSARLISETALTTTWKLTSNEISTTMSIYANSDPITTTLVVTTSPGVTGTVVADVFTGIALTQEISSLINGAAQTRTFNPNQLTSGTYRIWFEANDGRNPPVRLYAPNPIVINHLTSWPATWTATITATPDFRDLSVQWLKHPHADVDGYLLKVASRGVTETAVYTIGNTTGTLLASLDPNRPYSLTLIAYDTTSGLTSTSQTVVGTPDGAPITFKGPTSVLNVIEGVDRTIALTVTTTKQPYPGVVDLQMGCPHPIGVACTIDANGLLSGTNGLSVLFSADYVTPTIAGATMPTIISASVGLAAGNYVIPITAIGSGVSTTINITVALQVPNFALNASPGALQMNANQSRAIVISGIGFNGDDHPIGLKLDAPAGLLYKFDNSSIVPGGNTTLRITDTQDLASGVYPIVIGGEDDRFTATVQIMLTVSEPRFNLSTLQPQQSIRYGQSITTVFALDMTALDGWNTPVTLAFDPNSAQMFNIVGLTRHPATETVVSTLSGVLPNERVYLVAVSTAQTPQNTYLLSVDAQGGGKQQTLEVLLTVEKIEFKIYLPLVLKAKVGTLSPEIALHQ